MVENMMDDGVKPKPTIVEASGNIKPIVDVKFKVKIPFQSHIEEKPNWDLLVLPSFAVLK